MCLVFIFIVIYTFHFVTKLLSKIFQQYAPYIS
jgi:hypothetical protein